MSSHPNPGHHADVFTAWIRGWARSRDVAPPVAHADGFRIEVGLPRQVARYVFPAATPTIARLGREIVQPWVFLKASAADDELRAALPSHWEMAPAGFMMTCGEARFQGTASLPRGYTLQVDDRDAASSGRAQARVLADDGSTAAEGHVALVEGRAIYDRIGTDPAHQRRGLGRAVMHALQALAHAHGRHAGVLVATPMGRALYESLGWRLHAPWATAVIPGREPVA